MFQVLCPNGKLLSKGKVRQLTKSGILLKRRTVHFPRRCLFKPTESYYHGGEQTVRSGNKSVEKSEPRF